MTNEFQESHSLLDKPRKKNFLAEFLTKRREKKLELEKQKQLHKAWQEKSDLAKKLHYRLSDGVKSEISLAETGRKPQPIEARGHRNCNSMVLRSPDGIALVHASPYVLDEDEGKPTEYAIKPKDTDLEHHINAALHKLYPDPSRRTQNTTNQPLIQQQIEQAQASLQVTIVAGDRALLGKLAAFFEQGAKAKIQRQDGQEWSFPKASKLVAYDYGIGPKSILADSEQILLKEEADPNQRIREIYPPNDDQLKF